MHSLTVEYLPRCLGGGVKYSSKVVVFVVFEYTSGLITLVAFQGKEMN